MGVDLVDLVDLVDGVDLADGSRWWRICYLLFAICYSGGA
jgi:hypothetical protein